MQKSSTNILRENFVSLIPDHVDRSKGSSTLYDKTQSRSKPERSTSLKSSKQSVSKTKNQQKNQNIEPFYVKQRTKSIKEPSYIYQKPKEKKEPVNKQEQPKQRSRETSKQQAPEREVRLTRPFALSEIPSPTMGLRNDRLVKKVQKKSLSMNYSHLKHGIRQLKKRTILLRDNQS